MPTQLQRWFDYLTEYPQPIQTQAVLLGGTQIPVKLTQVLSELGIRSYSGYGMTEMASTVFAKHRMENWCRSTFTWPRVQVSE